MAISSEVINEIIEKADIYDVVSKYVNLKRSGSSASGLCPFHNEKTPSFHVSSGKQLYHCFGCGAGGTVINFIMQIENLAFVEAVKFLGDMYGVRVEDQAVSDDKTAKRKERLYAINKEAARFFYSNLAKPEGKPGLDYLISRNLSKKTITKFGLGFALDSWDALKSHLKAKGFNDFEMADAGLVSQKDTRSFDRFRNRVMYPIFDVRGNIIAFGGRVLDDSKPKYLNTSDTVIFDKSSNLFGLNFAKKSTSKTYILVEGYMDVITLHSYGVDTAVASLGTSLTENHAKILKRYADEVALCYDSDEPGRKATMRAVQILSKFDIKIKIITLKGAKDPDEFCKKFGVDEFFRVIGSAENPFLYKIGILKAKYDINKPEQKVELLKECAKELVKLPSEIEREVYAKEIARELDISFDAVNAQLRYRIAVDKNQTVRKEKTKIISDLKQKVMVKTNSNQLLESTEKQLINLMFYDSRVFDFVEKNFDTSSFSKELLNKFVSELKALKVGKEDVKESDIISRFDENSVGEISEILSLEMKAEDRLLAAKQLIISINNIKSKAEIAHLAREGNLEKVQEILNGRINNANSGQTNSN